MGRKIRSADASELVTYQLKITLSDLKPAIWRRLLVRGDMNLGLLHAVLQVTMGWTNSHLHQFLVGDVYYSDPTFELGADSPQHRVENENRALLREIAPRKGDRFWYEYDFGDSWYHEIRVEKIQAADPSWKVFAECLGGARACPPDNSGGPFGYMDLLDTLKHPGSEEYDDLIDWLPPSFDPKALEPGPDKVNKYLRKLKWPRTTVGQLAGVLMQRDGVRG
jgi:hypothetical protein